LKTNYFKINNLISLGLILVVLFGCGSTKSEIFYNASS